MKKIYLLLLVAILTPAILHAETAQKRKKKKKKQEIEQIEVPTKSNQKKHPSKDALSKFDVPKQLRYQVDILLPVDVALYYKNNKVVTSANLEPIKPYLSYYEGIKLAIADLESEGVALDINIHSFNKSTLDTLTTDPKSTLLHSDIIIGVVYGNDVETLARFGKTNTINFISTISPNDGTGVENVAFHILQPTLNTNIEALSNYANKEFPTSKKIIFHQNNEREKEHFLTIKNAFPKDKGIVNYDLSYAQIDGKTLLNTLDSTKVNSIFIPIIKPTEPEKIIDLLIQLPESYKIELFCMPSWNITRLSNKLKNNTNINLYATSPYQYDANTAFVKRIQELYAQQYNGDKANEMVFRGYEALYWYAQILNKFGRGFNTANYDHQNSPYTPFNMQGVENSENQIKYYENKYLYINSYNKGILQVITQ